MAPLVFVALLLPLIAASAKASDAGLLVAGSMNVDTFLPLARLPAEGENLTVLRGHRPDVDVPGGKGCNQAIACARLSPSSSGGPSDRKSVAFLGSFGNDDAAAILRRALTENDVDVSHCTTCWDAPSGRGYVFLERDTGKVSAVVSGGSNAEGWAGWEEYDPTAALQHGDEEKTPATVVTKEYLDGLLRGRSCLLLQREVPEFVNLILARHARSMGVVVLQDVGGEDRPMSSEMMSMCDYLIPNASELHRLAASVAIEAREAVSPAGRPGDEQVVLECARLLQRYGAHNVLVTLGDRGSILVDDDGTVTRQGGCRLPTDASVVDETGAGDCYRAAFAVALSEGRSMRECMRFASAAGALAVTKRGAVPSVPTREEAERLCCANFGPAKEERCEGAAGFKATARGAADFRSIPRGGSDNADDNDECPLLFGSRLNSMKDRPELWSDEPLTDVRQWVKRQATIRGLGCVDFNYPQHFHTWENAEAKATLDEAGLVAGAVCLRYPSKFARGAMIHPDPALRREAIELTKQAAQTARELKCDEVVVWSAYDGYDYPFQVNYDDKWRQIVEAFQECCDAYPDIKFSLEFKPTDENTRFFTVPSTGAAVLLVKEIGRPNMGLTLDVGHMLMAGENPGQSIAMAGDRLFGVQLNDGYTRLAAEDGMMFGSIHPSMALEAIYQLQRINFRGHLYFDTFPQRTDPVKEAEYNIQRVKAFWSAAKKLDRMGLRGIMDQHDALGALHLVNQVNRIL